MEQPWPHISRFMTLDAAASTDTTLKFTCELCKPKIKTISTSKTSSTNLRTHLRRLHKATYDEMELERLQESGRKRSRPSSDQLQPGGSATEQQDTRTAAQYLKNALTPIFSFKQHPRTNVVTVDSLPDLKHPAHPAPPAHPAHPAPPAHPAQPWPLISRFMTLDAAASTDTNLTFTCELCKPRIKQISTSKSSNTNLRTHLRRLHKATYEELQRLQQESGRKRVWASSDQPQPGPGGSASSTERHAATRPGGPASSTQRHAATRPPSRLTGSHAAAAVSQEKLNKLTVRFLVQGVHPLSIVERPDFKDYIHALVPGRQLPRRETLWKMLEEESGGVQSSLHAALSQLEHVATTADAWSTGGDGGSFLAVAVHWIDRDTLQVRSAALACRRIAGGGGRTFDVLAALLEDVYKDFNIQNKVALTTTDNGANFAKAFGAFADVQKDAESERQEEDDHDGDNDVIFTELTHVLSLHEGEAYPSLPPHQRCASHTLSLVATEDAEKAAKGSEPFARLSRSTMTKCQALWSKLSDTIQVGTVSVSIQETLGTQLTVPSASGCWSSTYASLENLKRIVTGGGDLDDVCGKLDEAHFTQAEKMFVSEYVTVVAPLSKALDILQSERMVYYGVLLPTVSILLDKLQKIKRESCLQLCLPLVDALIGGVKQRFGYVFEKDKCLMATASHPMFKMEYVPEEWKEYVAVRLREEVRRLTPPPSGEPLSEEEDDVASFFPKKREDPVDEVEAFERSPDDAPQKAFQSLPRMREVFIRFNTLVYNTLVGQM